MGYDYKIVSHLNSGGTKDTTYQQIIHLLDIQDDVIHGAQLSEGGVPQVISVLQLLKKYATGVKSIDALYQGEVIASV